MSLVFPIGTAPRLPNSQQHVTCPCRVDSSAVLGADIGARQAHAKPSQPGETVPRIFEWWMVSGIFKVAFLDQPMPTTELAWAACGHEIIWVTASATSKRDHMINRGRECRECEVVTASIIRPGRRWQGKNRKNRDSLNCVDFPRARLVPAITPPRQKSSPLFSSAYAGSPAPSRTRPGYSEIEKELLARREAAVSGRRPVPNHGPSLQGAI